MELLVDTKVTKFLNMVRRKYTEYMTTMGYEKQIERVSMKRGKRYYKIIVGNSVHSFIDSHSGDIFKPASAVYPAKHARGSIVTEADMWKAFSIVGYGIRYLH